MITSFKDDWLEDYYFVSGKRAQQFPSNIETVVKRKLDLLHVATKEEDLRIPPNNRFEHLIGNLSGWCSIRVNKQYRLIFKWESGEASNVYLDPHTYR